MTLVDTLNRPETRVGSAATPFKTLLVHVSTEAPSQARLAAAADYAQRHDAHLVGVGCALSPVLADPWLGYIDGSVVQTLLDDQTAQLAKAKASFAEATAALGDRAHWTEEPDYPGKSLSDHAAEADLVICGPEHGPATIVAQASDVIFDCGLPALMIPPNIHRLRFDTIVVAWRDKPEARRAVSAALPLLQQAESVVLLSVDPDKDGGEDDALMALKRRLDRHGVKSTPLLRRAANAEAPTIIMDTARAQGAGLIVLGAYGHSRAREWVLGGVTNSLLSESRTPLLLVH